MTILYLQHQLRPWSTGLLENLIVAQRVNDFFALLRDAKIL